MFSFPVYTAFGWSQVQSGTLLVILFSRCWVRNGDVDVFLKPVAGDKGVSGGLMTVHSPISAYGAGMDQDGDGWRASLDLEISCRGGQSVISRSRQKGPLTVQAPFYPEDDVCHLYLLHPPAGMVGGDRLTLTVAVKDEGSVLLTTPGATKFYKTNGREAEQSQFFRVAHNTALEWLPQETIYFPDARARVSTTILLEGTARFMGWEIHCLGLPVNKRPFGSGQARVALSLFRDEKPLLLETLKVSPDKTRFPAAFLHDQPVFGSFIATGASRQLLDLLRRELVQTDEILWAATLLADVLVIRCLGPSVRGARKLFAASWKLLRPAILGRQAVTPRIWAT